MQEESMGREIWVVAEYEGEELTDLTRELLGRVQAARVRGQRVCAVLLGSRLEVLVEQLSSYGAQRVYACAAGELEHYEGNVYASALADMITRYKPLLVICGMTANGRDLAGRLSVRLKSPFLPGCLSLKPVAENCFEVKRLLLNGMAVRTELAGGEKTTVLAFSAGARGLAGTGFIRPAEVVTVAPDLPAETGVRHLGIRSSGFREVDLAEADVLVSGGNGLGNKDLFGKLWELGELLGAPVGGSRVAVDKGWLPRERMVGVSGKSFSGRLCLAFGISGAIQHTMGIKDCGTIVAVNRDPQAPIFKTADLAVVGDVQQVLPLLVERLKELGLRGSGVEP
ncbi:MAG: electron transfer flavoprotein subunit alpha/FixB family protein [Peptococcaceae bacterium MAG4]|nr:electron transfer flavoprotein subunit alpha/FixB family protein [Peptococcaceae bacterium MAG4]